MTAYLTRASQRDITAIARANNGTTRHEDATSRVDSDRLAPRRSLDSTCGVLEHEDCSVPQSNLSWLCPNCASRTMRLYPSSCGMAFDLLCSPAPSEVKVQTRLLSFRRILRTTSTVCGRLITHAHVSQ